MQHFPAVRGRLLAGHFLLAFLCIVLGGASGYLLLAYPAGLLPAAGLVTLAAAAVLVPAVVYRIYLLLTAEYVITPAGGLVIRLGARRQVVPLEEIEEIRSGGKIPDAFRKAGPGWLAAWRGKISGGGETATEWTATDRGGSLLLLVAKNRSWAISPSDPSGFAQKVAGLSARGSLERIEPESDSRPPFILDILQMRSAFAPLIGGAFLLVALGAFLLAILSNLPADQAFRFTPSGLPSSPGNASRLLILPLVGGAIWAFNAVAGWRAWRTDRRIAAYALWITAAAVAIGLWIATLLLIRAG